MIFGGNWTSLKVDRAEDGKVDELLAKIPQRCHLFPWPSLERFSIIILSFSHFGFLSKATKKQSVNEYIFRFERTSCCSWSSPSILRRFHEAQTCCPPLQCPNSQGLGSFVSNFIIHQYFSQPQRQSSFGIFLTIQTLPPHIPPHALSQPPSSPQP